MIRNVQFLRTFCCEIRASAPVSFWEASDAELARAYNGVGADGWPVWMRSVVTMLLRPFAAAALVHDWEYSLPDKRYGAFTAANWRLFLNIGREAVYDCRPALVPAGVCAAILCQLFGYRAYLQGRPGR